MKKIIKIMVCILLIIAVVGILDIWHDHRSVQKNVIRLHVVANSDKNEDQQIKLQVKDAIVEHLQKLVPQFPDKDYAMLYIQENLADIEHLANNVLDSLGEKDRAVATLCQEEFDMRVYDTFSLPSGVYDALRIEIGEGKGKNWWCVVFPSLCLPATTADFQDTAVSAGFSKDLAGTLSGERKYEFRFFFLDCIGKLENLFR